MNTFGIYEISDGSVAPYLVAGGFATADSAKDAFTEHMDIMGFNVLVLEKDDECEAYDACVARGPVMRTFAIEEIKSSYTNFRS